MENIQKKFKKPQHRFYKERTDTKIVMIGPKIVTIDPKMVAIIDPKIVTIDPKIMLL